VLALTVFVGIFLFMSCSSNKGPAEAAIKTAEETVNAAKVEAVKIIPDDVKSLEDTLASVKEKFIKGEYKIALQEATALAAKARKILDDARVKKQALTEKWASLNQEFPQMVASIESKIASLSKLKKLPANLTKEKFEEAKTSLTAVKDEWIKAEESFKAGSLNEAIHTATAVKERTLKIMEVLGMSDSAPAATPVNAKE